MRIIGGTFGGRRLRAPSGNTTRPTSDRVREALFSILGAPPYDARVLDLFAGSGGLGLEALSRGAAQVTFVDQQNTALVALKANIAEFNVGAATKIVRGEAMGQLQRLSRAKKSFDWIFIDPPYATELATQCLAEIGKGAGVLREGGLVIVEHDKRSLLAENYGVLTKSDTRLYGDTGLAFFEISD